jgi:hypothetical protein
MRSPLDLPASRRLDFLMQELNREANTLSSKSQDLETTRSAVDMNEGAHRANTRAGAERRVIPGGSGGTGRGGHAGPYMDRAAARKSNPPNALGLRQDRVVAAARAVDLLRRRIATADVKSGEAPTYIAQAERTALRQAPQRLPLLPRCGPSAPATHHFHRPEQLEQDTPGSTGPNTSSRVLPTLPSWSGIAVRPKRPPDGRPAFPH